MGNELSLSHIFNHLPWSKGFWDPREDTYLVWLHLGCKGYGLCLVLPFTWRELCITQKVVCLEANVLFSASSKSEKGWLLKRKRTLTLDQRLERVGLPCLRKILSVRLRLGLGRPHLLKTGCLRPKTDRRTRFSVLAYVYSWFLYRLTIDCAHCALNLFFSWCPNNSETTILII